MLKKFKKIYNALTSLVVAAVLLLVILLVGVRVVGLKPFAVLSGSMEPKYHVGSVIYVRDVDPKELKIGDPLTFTKSGAIVTHQIVDIINPDDPEKILFVTQGLTNNITDGYIPPSSIIGKSVFTIPYLGYVSVFFQKPIGVLSSICVVVIVLMVSLALELIPEKKDASASPTSSDLPEPPKDPDGDSEDNIKKQENPNEEEKS